MNLGEQIKKSRKSAGMNAAILARLIGMSPANVSKIENGILSPSPEIVVRIASVLGDDAVLYAYMRNDLVFRATIPRIFPDLNNLRKDLSAVLSKVVSEAEEAIAAVKELSCALAAVDFKDTPGFNEKFSKAMKELLDAKRMIEQTESVSTSLFICSKEELREIYRLQQRDCEEQGLHRPEKEEAAA